ncbi:MAG: ABC transporter permease [Alphaproteobacteria bacterium]|nr:ABC transporter permease [Alphaproteobacteria bacterium]
MSADLFAPFVKAEDAGYLDSTPGAARFAKSEAYVTLVWRKFRRSVTGMIGLSLVVLLLLMALFADFVSPLDPKEPYLAFAPPDPMSFATKEGYGLRLNAYQIVEGGELDPITFQPLTGPDYDHPHPIKFLVQGYPYKLLGLIPASVHLFGTDDGSHFHILGTDKFGRDIFSRGVSGSRITLFISLTTVALLTLIGTSVGLISGYVGGRFDSWVQRFVEIVLAFPQLPLYLALASVIPVTAPNWVFFTFLIAVLTTVSWAQLSREVRGKTLALARIEYVRAAQAVGAGDGRIIFRHILPNVLSHVIVAVTIWIPAIILIESFLGFLGFAVKPPLISWGMMLQDCGNFSVLGSYPWILSPVGFVLLAVFAFNALGDGLRDAIDPY